VLILLQAGLEDFDGWRNQEITLLRQGEAVNFENGARRARQDGISRLGLKAADSKEFFMHLGAPRRRMKNVIARNGVTKQSPGGRVLAPGDCFATLAMTA
jgi:hypothetical protein